MKTLILVMFSLISISLSAQQTSIWIGGTPGRESAWDEARNWNTNQVPDQETRVIIWN